MVAKRTIGQAVDARILVLRGHRVMLDSDLAELYGVEVRALNQAIKRNPGRFPPDFMFSLTQQEVALLRSQNVISNTPCRLAEVGAPCPSHSRSRASPCSPRS
jgi:hypothetical protein